MRGSGVTIRLTERESFGMLMVTTLRENGRMTKQMDTVHIYIPMGPSMRASGKKTCRMGLAQKHGLMAQNIMGSIRWARSKDMVSMSGMMGLDTKGFGMRIGYKDLGFIHG